MCAPTGPIQFRAGPDDGGAAETLNEASCGEYESRLSASRIARLSPTNPTSSLMRLFSVGVRMRTKSPRWLGIGEGSLIAWVARALSRGAQWEELKYATTISNREQS